MEGTKLTRALATTTTARYPFAPYYKTLVAYMQSIYKVDLPFWRQVDGEGGSLWSPGGVRPRYVSCPSPTHSAMQTKKIAAVSRDWTGCRLECLISSTAHTAVWVAQGLTLCT